MNIKKLLGQKIKEIRKNRNLTQEQVSELVGIEPASLSNIENGKFYPTAENLDRILSAFKITPSELFKIEHNQDIQDLEVAINEILHSHPEKMKDFYKIAKALVE